MDSFLIPLFSVLFTIALYPIFMIYVALFAGLGVFTYLLFAVMFSPFVVLLYYVVRKRALNSLKLLLDGKFRVWDVSKSLDEYIELLRKQRQHRH